MNVEHNNKFYYCSDLSDQVYVVTRRFPSNREWLREIPLNGPTACAVREKAKAYQAFCLRRRLESTSKGD